MTNRPKMSRSPARSAEKRRKKMNAWLRQVRIQRSEAQRAQSERVARSKAWQEEAIAQCTGQVRDYAAAVVSFSKAIMLQPQTRHLRFQRSIALIELKRWQEARADLEEAIRLGPKDSARYLSDYDANLHFKLAKALKQLGQLEEAVNAFARAAELWPVAKYYFEHMEALLDLDRYEQALVPCNELIDIEPSAVAFQKRAYCHYQLGRYGEAIADAGESIRVGPSLVAAYWIRGDSLVLQGNFEAAVTDYTELIRLVPKDATVYLRRASSFFILNNFIAAIADCTSAICLDESYSSAYKLRANCYCNLDEWAQAVADWTEAIELDRQDANCWFARGVCYGELGLDGQAIEDFSEAIRLSANVRFLLTRAEAYERLGRAAEALLDRQAAARLN